jgi:hypothetical protein
MPDIRNLCVLFDASCGLCTGGRGLAEAVARYPSIEPGELARQAFAVISRNRGALSNLLGAHTGEVMQTDEAIEKELRTILVTGCETKRE